MFKWGIGAATAALATVVTGGVAQAQTPYIALGAGWTRIDSADTTIQNGIAVGSSIVLAADLEDDWSSRASLGFDFGSLRFEGEFGMANGDVSAYSSSSPGGITRAADGSVKLLSAVANAYYDFDMGPGLTPFVGVGGGAFKAEYELSAPSPTAPNGAIVTLVDDEQTSFGWQAMAGFSLPLAGNMSLTAQYRYFDAGTFDMVGIQGRNTAVDIKGSSWDAGVRWTF